MNKEIVEKTKNDVTVQAPHPVQSFVSGFFPLPFIRFSMSRTSMFSDGQNTHIEAEEHRFENGKLDSNYFEGTLAGDYMKQVNALMEQQMSLFFKTFNLFLPFKPY